MKKTVLKNICHIHRKTPLLKGDSNAGVFCGYYTNLKTTCFEEHLRTAAFERGALIFY